MNCNTIKSVEEESLLWNPVLYYEGRMILRKLLDLNYWTC